MGEKEGYSHSEDVLFGLLITYAFNRALCMLTVSLPCSGPEAGLNTTAGRAGESCSCSGAPCLVPDPFATGKGNSTCVILFCLCSSHGRGGALMFR